MLGSTQPKHDRPSFLFGRMAEQAPPGRPHPIGVLDVFLSCVVFFCFALAKPILDLLGR